MIEKNTVLAQGQMENSGDLSFLGDKNAPTKILIVGNSITRHGPRAEIGWNCDWGMAASSPEKDFVHRLYAKLLENGQKVYMRIRQCADWEIHFLEENVLSNYDGEKAFEADIVVFRLGENVPVENRPYFEAAARKFVSHICSKHGKTIFTTCFWANPIVDEGIRNLAKERGEICLEGGLSKDEKNMALGQFAHEGVAMHPSDKGMEELAELIYGALKK